MTEYINKWKVVDMLTALENEFQHYKPFHGFEHPMYRKVCEVEMEIGKMPGADVSPVVHGDWVDGRPYVNSRWKVCSVCHQTAPEPHGGYNYCPNCGAKMDLEVKDA